MKKTVALSLIFLPLFLKCAESAKSPVNPEIGKVISTIGTILNLRMSAIQNPNKEAVVTNVKSLHELNNNLNNTIEIYNTTKDPVVKGMIDTYFEGLTDTPRKPKVFSTKRYVSFLEKPGNTDAITNICNTWQQRILIGEQLASLFNNPSGNIPDDATVFNTILGDMRTFQTAAQLDSNIVNAENPMDLNKIITKDLKEDCAKKFTDFKDAVAQRAKYTRMFALWFDPALNGATKQQVSYACKALDSNALRSQMHSVASMLRDINNVYTARQNLEKITRSTPNPTPEEVTQIQGILSQLDVLYTQIDTTQKQVNAAVNIDGQTCLRAVVCGLLPSFIQRKQS